MTKLTLSVDEGVVEKAKRIAEANHTSVSAMFSHFVESVAARGAPTTRIGPLTRKLTGIVSIPPGKEYKELLTEALAARHGEAR